MSDFSISPEWVLTELGEIVEIHSGVGFPKHLQGQVDEEIPLYKVSDISNAVLNSNSELYQANNYLSQEMADSLKGHYFRKGSTLFAKIGEAVKLNRRAEVGLAGLADNNVMGVSALSLINDRFIFHFLNTIDLGKRSRSSAIPSIRKSDIEELTILLPPKAEQEKIAELLDNHLAQVETIKARLKAIPKILKKFRQSVLADAVSGRLTEEWRLENKMSFDWEETTLGKAVNYGKCDKKSPNEIQENEWVLELEDIEKDSSKILNRFDNSIRKSKSTKNVFKKNDVLYGKLRPYLNKVVIADKDGVCTTEIIPITTSENILSYFLFIWLKSPFFISYVNQITYGVNMPRLGTTDGKNAPFKIPPIEEQTEIVARVEQLFTFADTIETQVNNALQRVNQLTQSILHQAFTGQLTADWRAKHPELITGDNSAEKLLEQIQTAKKPKGKPKSTKKVKNAT